MPRISKPVTLSMIGIVILLFVLIALLKSYLSSGDYRVVSTTKLIQLTGIEDRQWPSRPTGQILGGDRSGVTGTDLGYPFEHGSRLYFLFGDTRETDPDLCDPEPCGTDVSPKIHVTPEPKLVHLKTDWDKLTRSRVGADTIAHVPIQSDPQRGLPLQFETDQPDDVGTKFHAVTLDGKVLGNFETPVSGFSDGFETIYAFFTLRDMVPGCMRPEGCSLGDTPSAGQSKLAASTDQGRTFTSLWTVSTRKFLWPVPVVVEGKLVPGLPSELARTKVLMLFGTGNENGRFGLGHPYLSVASMNLFGVQRTWKYYGGTASDAPVVWQDKEDGAVPLPPFGSTLRDRVNGPGYHHCVGQFSVQYDPVLAKWMMMYGCFQDAPDFNTHNGRGIFLRMADSPWGPWTPPLLVFDPG